MVEYDYQGKIKKAEYLREQGQTQKAIEMLMEVEHTASQSGERIKQLKALGHRVVCYLHLYQNGTPEALIWMLVHAEVGFKLANGSRGKPEVKTFRYRLAQALYLRKDSRKGDLQKALHHLNIVIRGVSAKDPQYFEFKKLRAVVAAHLSAELRVLSEHDINESLDAVTDWHKNHKDDPNGSWRGKMYQSGVIISMAEAEIVLGHPERALQAIGGAELIAHDLASNHKMPQRLNQVAALKTKLFPTQKVRRTNTRKR